MNGTRALSNGGRGVLYLLLAGALGACHGNAFQIRGSGVPRSEDRAVAPFQNLKVSGSTHVVARVGETPYLRVTADDNLLPYVVTEVVDGTLRVHLKSGSYHMESPLTVEVGVPTLRLLAVAGSAVAELTGLNGEEFKISVAGSGKVKGSGAVDRLTIAISGSGNMDLYQLQAREAGVKISGSGDVKLQVSESLEANISGSGNIRYRGDPRTSVHVVGSGHVSRGT